MDKKDYYEFIINSKGKQKKAIEKELEDFFCENAHIKKLLSMKLLQEKINKSELSELIEKTANLPENILFKELLFLENFHDILEKYRTSFNKIKKYNIERIDYPEEVNDLISSGESLLSTNNSLIFVGVVLANIYAMEENISQMDNLFASLEEIYCSSPNIIGSLAFSRQVIIFSSLSRKEFKHAIEDEDNIFIKIYYLYLYETNRFIRIEFLISIVALLFFIFWNHIIFGLWFLLFTIINLIGYFVGKSGINQYVEKGYIKKQFVLIAALIISVLVFLFINM